MILQKDGVTCEGGEYGAVQAPVVGVNNNLDEGVATCYGTQHFSLDTCIEENTDSCTWIFQTPACPA